MTGTRKRCVKWEELLKNMVLVFEIKFLKTKKVTPGHLIYFSAATKNLGELNFCITGNRHILGVKSPEITLEFWPDELGNKETIENIKEKLEKKRDEKKVREIGEDIG